MKTKPLLATILLLCGNVVFAADLVHRDRVLAVVDDTVITQFDVQKQMAGIIRGMKEDERNRFIQDHVEEVASDILDQLVRDELIYAEFLEQGFSVPSTLIQERLDRIIVQQTGGDREAFKKMLADGPLSMEDLREKVRRNIAVDLMAAQNVRQNLHVSPADIREYYDNHPDKFRQARIAKLRLLIVDATGQSDAEQQQTELNLKKKSLLQLLRRKTGQKAPLAELAKELGGTFSEGTYTFAAPENADGSAPASQDVYPLRAELRDHVKNLVPGQRTAPIELDGQIALVEMVDQTKAGRLPLDSELRAALRQRLKNQERKRLMDDFLGELTAKHFVKRLQ